MTDTDRINVYHGRSYRKRQPLCETPDCPNLGTNVSEEYGNDGKHWADVLRCDSCYLIAQSKVRKMKDTQEARSKVDNPLKMAVTVLRIGPGDVLAVTLPKTATEEQGFRVKEELKKLVPEIKTLVFVGIESLTAIRRSDVNPDSLDAELVVVEAKR